MKIEIKILIDFLNYMVTLKFNRRKYSFSRQVTERSQEIADIAQIWMISSFSSYFNRPMSFNESNSGSYLIQFIYY